MTNYLFELDVDIVINRNLVWVGLQWIEDAWAAVTEVFPTDGLIERWIVIHGAVAQT